MTIQAKIIADSISATGKRITTFQLTYPRFIHAELKTHRILASDSENEVYIVEQSIGLMDDRNLSRNASSSRAIPVSKMIDMVRHSPAMPIHWGKNQPGMQANEQLTGDDLFKAQELWHIAARQAANVAENMMAIGLHKQVANRILEPFQHISVVLTATEFDNWFELRAHPDAQPEIHELAIQMMNAMFASTPKELSILEWHLPYVTQAELDSLNPETARKVSAARCCRVSYLKHDGGAASVEEDLALCDRLAGARPIHASPFEHQATPDILIPGNRMQLAHWQSPKLHGNFVGWIQYRKQIEQAFE